MGIENQTGKYFFRNEMWENNLIEERVRTAEVLSELERGVQMGEGKLVSMSRPLYGSR